MFEMMEKLCPANLGVILDIASVVNEILQKEDPDYLNMLHFLEGFDVETYWDI